MRREQNQATRDGNGYGIRFEVRAHLLLFIPMWVRQAIRRCDGANCLTANKCRLFDLATGIDRAYLRGFLQIKTEHLHSFAKLYRYWNAT
jgi:hypothetical protein